MSRRIQTEANEDYRTSKDTVQSALRKINLNSKNPLSDNKSVLNEPKKPGSSQNQPEFKGNFSTSSIKTANRIKSILANEKKTKEQSSRPVQTLVTEPYEKISKLSSSTQKTTDNLVQRLFNKDSKKANPKETSLLGKKEPPQPADKYLFEEVVGSGTFGVVYKGRNKDTLDVVAVKKVLQDKKYKNREFEILKQLNHINVLKMKDAFFTQ